MTDPAALDFEPGQIVTVFRSRLRDESVDEYVHTSADMHALVTTMPGLVEVKSFTADDGERVTLVTFTDEDSQRAWREHADHRAAQRAGRDRVYATYSLQVCETIRVRSFTAE
jgi:heme-degrading monooxygenase HmoA